ncbi:class I SAM-dependent methyltransferase [Tengunoibacter tsumagoiensis]|uniref:Methyltransferase domain-containing protein n=1 Tax=Tengunoibacter tsumagoiensis TaxID=2014871 RepID=A0A402A6L6_9CHLR|nr:class I SAM-dependent methyltransferase [Tengunoibacter tsumagoiensis]GCE14780.1 hypothetical protein KTT_46390 [Tengunoibacter tsumagoiensis]
MELHDPIPQKYLIDLDQAAEKTRLTEQEKLITKAMGGLFPEGQDLSQARKLLDMACGPGSWVTEVARKYPELEVIGGDINPTFVNNGNLQAEIDGLKNLSFQIMDIRKPLPFDDNTFDLVNARLILGFMDREAWPILIAEVKRILRPGGVIRLSECEYASTSSPALQRINGYLSQALAAQGRTFSPDGRSFGLTHRIGKLLQEAGFSSISKRAFHIDSSYGSDLHESTLHDSDVVFVLLRPYLIQSGALNEKEYDELYEAIYKESRSTDYTGITFGLTTWGRKA